jgi:hypothetical protein
MKRAAAAILIAGGMLVVLGSFSVWGACPLEPCGGDFGLAVIYERSGIQFGPGVVTAILGVLLALLGFIASRKLDRMVPLIGVVAAGGVLITIGIHLLTVYGGESDIVTGPPYLGLYITAIGSILCLAASVRLWHLRRRQPRASEASTEGHL